MSQQQKCAHTRIAYQAYTSLHGVTDFSCNSSNHCMPVDPFANAEIVTSHRLITS